MQCSRTVRIDGIDIANYIWFLGWTFEIAIDQRMITSRLNS